MKLAAAILRSMVLALVILGNSRAQVQTVAVRNGAPPPGNDAASKVTLDPDNSILRR